MLLVCLSNSILKMLNLGHCMMDVLIVKILNFILLDRLETNYHFKLKVSTYMRKRTFDFQDDEIESESYCLSSNSQTESLHSGRLSDLSTKKNEKNSTKSHSTKSESSGTIKKDSNRHLDHHIYTFRQQQSVTLVK